jgi:hypothetical protein
MLKKMLKAGRAPLSVVGVPFAFSIHESLDGGNEVLI